MANPISFKDYQILKKLYAGRYSYLTVGQAGKIIGITSEGARCRLNKLVERGWLDKAMSYRAYYVPVKSTEMRTKIVEALNNFEESEMR